MKSTRRWQQLLLNSLAIILGNALYSLAVALFLEPAGLITGGATGIALAFGRLTGLSVSGFLFLFNMSMLVWGWAVLGKKFALNTLASSVLSPAFLGLFERLPDGRVLTEDIFLCTIFSGLGIGVALGMVIRAGASTGGMDIPPLVLQKWFRWPVSITMMLFDIAILLVQAAFSQPEQVLYGIVLVITHTIVMDKMLMLGDSRTEVKIISTRSDEIRTAIVARLQTLAEEKGVKVNIQEFNGQNDATVLNQIGAQVVGDGVDLIIPIATLAAQCMVTAADGTDIPIVYAAISDPEAAGLTGLDNVTGTSDALNTAFILDMMLAANPDIKTVGLLYSNSEANSATPIAEAKAYLQEKQIDFVEKTGNTSGEIVEAAASMVGRVDAVFTPTDNVVMAAEVTVAETLNEAGIPHYTGADSFVAAGAFATCGVNYTELGTYTADMAMDILLGGAVPEFHVMDGGIITVNTETAAILGIDYSVFSSMANTVVEVKTGE